VSTKLEGASETKWRLPPELNIAEAPSVLSRCGDHAMSTTDSTPTISGPKPKRADARRNYDKVIAAARDAFTESGAETSLEEIARRAGVGIGTLYRNFPNRQALLEAVYVGEVEGVCASAAELTGLEPWEALDAWLRRFVTYMATKQALAAELLSYSDFKQPLFQNCRAALFGAGGPLLERAQAAGEVRSDTELSEVIQLVGGVAKIPVNDPAQVEHLLQIVLDGLRVHRAG
jgi:AcrR family transcriptional regulator